MDPHQRVFLNAAWQAVQDSGLTDINGTNMGVFVGASGTGFYQQREESLLTSSTLTGALANLAAARVSNAFNLKGPSLSVDTACSSSLVSVDLAVKSILNGESDTAIAGGVQILETIVMYLMFSKAGILSPQGKCFTFDDKANGFVPGEGAGAVVLKRYSEAISDGDRVYAVIKGSATNNDGASLGIMSPNPEGQENIIRTALKQAKVNPEDIGYVEAHGTGTNVGDLIEVRSLSLAFNEKNAVAKQSCAIGSVKTNMGHQLAAAGIAGLMKAALTVYHKEIPATLNCSNERKDLKLKDTPFYVNHKTKPWPDNGKRRLAAVNSFGFGGTNAHVILSNAYHTDIQYPTVTNDDEPLVYCLSAKSELSLDVSKDVFACHVVKTSNKAKDVAHTYSARRDHYRQNRLAIVANSLQDAAAVARGEKVKYASIVERKNMSPARSRVAWMFSGQGSQHPAMAKTLYKNEPVFKDVIDSADEIATPLLGVSLRDLLLSSTNLKEVSATELTQPLVFTMDYALACLWKSWGVKPDFMMGHSIGEYVAACIAEVFTFEDALKVVIKRGQLMGAMPSGCGMTAVLLSANDTMKTLEELNLPLDVAAFNGPTSTVVSGELSVLKKLHEKLDGQKSVYQPLSVSHAFHSRHMEPMLDEFREYLSTVMMRMPTIPIVSNVTGELIETGDIDSDYWANYWVNHIRQPVQFHKGIEYLVDERTKVFIEIGAQEHLAGLTRRIVDTDKRLVVTSMPKVSGDGSAARDTNHIAKTKAQLYTYGVDIDWAKYYAMHGDRRLLNAKPGNKVERRVTKNASVSSVKMVSVPTYSLERRSMFRLVGGADYPFKHLFNKIADAQFSYMPDTNCVLFKDHIVCNMPMLSGAGQCDLISHLYAQSYKLPPKSLRNLSFHQPWLEKSQLSVAFKGEEEKEFSVTDARGNVVFKGFADALTKGEIEPSVSIALIEKQLTHHYSQTEVYDIFSSCGVEYGPFHRSIVDLKASSTQALARLKPAAGNAASWQHGHYLHPGILDCAFQAAAGILMAGLTESSKAESNKADEFPTMVPLGIESINNYKCLQEAEYYSHVVLCKDEGNTAGSDIISCDVTVYDLKGEPCASIKKLQLKRLPAMMTAGAAKKKSVQQTAAQQVAPQAVHQAAVPEQKTAQLFVQKENTAAAEFFQFQWLETTFPQSPLTEQTCIFFGSSDAIEQQFAPAMAALGVNVILIPYEYYNTLDEAGMLAVLEKIDTADSIVYLGDYAEVTTGNDVADMANMRCLFNLVKSLSKASRKNKTFKKIQLIRVTQNAIPLNLDGNKFDIRKSLVTGFLRSVRIEFPLLNVRQVSFAEMSASDVANKLTYELSNTDATPECLYSATKRFDYSVQPVDVSDQYKREDVFNKDKVFWIIGGTSGVGQLLAHHIASNYKSNLVLSGSRQLPDPSAYDEYLADNENDSIANTIKSIREIEALGSKVTYVRTDVRSTDSQRLSLEAIRKVHKRIDGIYFSALQLDDKMVLQKEWTGYRNMIDMRVNGLQTLINQTQNEAMDFFIMFSSVASITGNLGQSDYSASSVYMDNVPYAQSTKNGCRYITVQWGAWELGQQVSEIVLEHMTRSGFVHIAADAGMQALEKIILSGEKNLAYVPGSLNASQIADSINGLRQGLSSKPKKKTKPINNEVIAPAVASAVVSEVVASETEEEKYMSKNNPVVSGNASDGQIQLLMNEFDKQRDMLMKLCDSQNALLANTLGGSGLAQVQSLPPQTIQPAPQIVESVAQPVVPQPAVVESVQQPVAEMFQAAEPVPVEPEAAPAVAEQSVSPEISAAASQERPTDVFEYVKGLMAKAVEMDRDDIDPDQNIMELGADSMTAMSMVKDMETLYDIELPATLLFEYSTLNELVDFLKEEIGEG
jgi:microcystin synthetase protein McyD